MWWWGVGWPKPQQESLTLNGGRRSYIVGDTKFAAKLRFRSGTLASLAFVGLLLEFAKMFV